MGRFILRSGQALVSRLVRSFSLSFYATNPAPCTIQIKKIGADVISREKETDLSASAKRLLDRKLKKVEDGARDVYL